MLVFPYLMSIIVSNLKSTRKYICEHNAKIWFNYPSIYKMLNIFVIGYAIYIIYIYIMQYIYTIRELCHHVSRKHHQEALWWLLLIRHTIQASLSGINETMRPSKMTGRTSSELATFRLSTYRNIVHTFRYSNSNLGIWWDTYNTNADHISI